MKEKYIPARKCIVCGEKKGKSQLFRIVRAECDFVFDRDMKMDGRGSYVCRDFSCISKMEKKRALSRAFKEKVASEKYEILIREFEEKL